MKTSKLTYGLLAMAAVATLSACDENSWNKHIDGFDEVYDQPVADVRTIDYTLTAADYAAIAANATNVGLAGEENAAALAAVGKNKCFSEAITASDYVPAFLESTSFPYFTLTDGSAVKLAYNVQNDVPAEVAAGRAAQALTIPDEFYAEEVWADDNYINAFAPSHPAGQYIGSYLNDYALPANGTVCVVNYSEAATDPVFGGGAGEHPAEPVVLFSKAFTDDLEGFTIENVTLPEGLEYIWNYGGENYGAKASGYADGANYDTESWLISPVINLAGNTDLTMTFEHATNFFADVETAKAEVGAYIREENGQWTRLDADYPATLSWTFISAGDIDLNAFAGKKVQIGFKYSSTAAKAGTWEVKNLVVKGTPATDAAPARSTALQGLVINQRSTAYSYDETAGEWVAASYVVLQPDTYSQMGQSHPDLSTAEPYLSTYLAVNYPYAAPETVKNVLWRHYSGGTTSYDCSQYVFDGTVWKANDFIVEETAQFVRNAGHWIYNPNVTLVLPAGKNQELSTLYFQACVDWVYENICVPLGDTSIKSGAFYVTTYGNNEYYSGTSAYQGNVDLRADKAREQYPAGYQNMTDEQIVALMKERFMNEVMPGALAKLHPDATPIAGIDLLYTITFGVYTGTSATYTAVFKVTAPATFKPVSCTWDTAE